MLNKISEGLTHKEKEMAEILYTFLSDEGYNPEKALKILSGTAAIVINYTNKHGTALDSAMMQADFLETVERRADLLRKIYFETKAKKEKEAAANAESIQDPDTGP